MIAKICNDVKDKYIITHEENAERMKSPPIRSLAGHDGLNYHWQVSKMSMTLFRESSLTCW